MCLLAIDISSSVNFYIWWEVKVKVHCFHTDTRFTSTIYQKDELFHHSVTLDLYQKSTDPALWVSLVSAAEARWRRERPHLESVGIRRTRCAVAVALRPTTFRSWPVVNVATLPSGRGSITGVLKLKDEIPPGLVKWGT